MKIIISFISGVIVCSLFLFGVKAVIPTRAETNNSDELSANSSQGLSGLVPDIETIYRQCLITPFEKAEKKIYDPDIAEYYSELLDKTGLRSEKSGMQ